MMFVYHSGHLYFPKTFFLVPNMDWISLEVEVNLIFFNFIQMQNGTHELPLYTTWKLLVTQVVHINRTILVV